MPSIMTLDELYNFYAQQNKNLVFESKETGKPIHVMVNGLFELEHCDSEMFLHSKIKFAHLGTNPNQTKFSEENMKRCLPTIINKAVVCEIVEVGMTDYGMTKDFGHHAIQKIVDKDGNEHKYYKEHVVGVFPESCNPRFEFDVRSGLTYAVADCIIYRNYGNETAEILEAKNGSKVSAELIINSLTYDAKERVVEITDFEFAGVCLLGEAVETGMIGTRMDLYSSAPSIFTTDAIQQQTNEMLNEVNSTQFSKTKKGGSKALDKFNELLAKYGKTKEEISFEIDGLTDEQLTAKFEEAFGEQSQSNDDTTDSATTATEGEDTTNPDAVATEPSKEDETTTENAKSTVVVSTADGTANFELTLNARDSKVWSAIQEHYGKPEDTYYSVTAYDSYVIFRDCDTNKYYRQNYSVNESDEVILTGDREAVYPEFLTKEEYDSVKTMRANYAEYEAKVKKYEAEHAKTEKLAVIDNSANYSALKETDAFKALIADVDKYSLDEFKSQCKMAFADTVIANGTYEAHTEPKYHGVPLAQGTESETKPYGGLFDE